MAWNGSDGALAPKVEEKKRPAIGRGLIAGLIVVVFALAAWFAFLNPSNPASAKEDESASKAIADAIPDTKASSKIEDGGGAFSVLVSKDGKPLDLPKEVKVEKPSRTKAEKLAPVNNVPPKRRRKTMFKNGTDQLIYLAVFASNGHSIPPLPRIDKADTDRFINSLRKPIEIEDDDTDQVKEMKKSVMEIRNSIAEIIEQNPDMELSDVLNAHRDEFNNALNLHAEAKRGYDKLIEEGDLEAAEIYREKANEILDECGAVLIEANEE